MFDSKKKEIFLTAVYVGKQGNQRRSRDILERLKTWVGSTGNRNATLL